MGELHYISSEAQWRLKNLSGSKRPKQGYHQRTLQSINSGGNNTQTVWSNKILQSGLLQRILCLPYGQSIQYEDNIQHNTQKRKIQIHQSYHGCQIQPGCIPDENGSNSRGTIHDDITIFGKSDDDHDANLIGLMEHAKETGLTLNSKKCSIGQDSVSFFGVIFGKDGMCPDPKKIQGILEMPPPKDTTQLQSFLGMVNFMHNFIPHLSEHTATLRGQLTKNAVFHWDESTNAAFQKLKSLIAEAHKRSLKFYNRNLPLTVQADASKHGLGAALLQQ